MSNINLNAGVTTADILGPDGELATKPTTILTQEEADILRSYKKFLAARGLREALYCNACWSGDREDGCKAFVTDGQIAIECRCRLRFFQGQTF